MAAYDLEEQEQLAEIKAWWKQYGNLLINALTAAAVAVLAWQGWNWYQGNQSAQAAAVYHVLQQAAHEKDTQRVKAASGELTEKFGRTSYAPLGALIAAKSMMDAGDAKTAKAQLLWAVDKSKNEIRDLARLRLATLLIDEKAYDEALKQLDGSVTPAFEPRFIDNRGDIFSLQGKKDEARKAYQAAIDKLAEIDKNGQGVNSQSWQLQSNAVYRELIQRKLDALGTKA